VPVALLAAAAAWQLGWRVTGSIAAADWLGVALLAALLVAAVLLSGGAVRPSRPALLALALLGAYVVWVGASIAWSPVPTLAKEETELVALYALALAVPWLTLGGPTERVGALGALALVPAGLAVATAIRLVAGTEPGGLFPEGRLEFPVAYANADAALFLLGLWPGLALAASRALPVAVRALGTAAAALSLAAWIATQSKGGAVAVAASSLAVFALAPGRLRLAVPALLAAAAAGAAAVPLTAPYRAEDTAAASSGAGWALLVVAAVALAAGAAYAAVDRRTMLSERSVRWAGRAALALLAAAAVLLLAVTTPTARDVRSAWDAFSEYHPDAGESGTHLATLGGSNRYDFWRVALAGSRDDPLLGIGARGFGPLYLREGRSHETPARTHSLVFEVLLENGIVGVLLLGGSLAVALGLVVANARRRRLHGIAALGGCVGWLAHASVDWIWTFPATGIVFFLLLGVGSSRSEPLLRRRLATGGGVAALAAGLVLFLPPWLAARLTERALAHPATSAGDLRWARRLDPVSVRPDFAATQVAATPAAAVAALERAARKEPESAAARYVLGVTLLELGRTAAARQELEAAKRLAPRDDLVSAALERARAGP
jgi:tetratricopeptide (TPR) repeat protein